MVRTLGETRSGECGIQCRTQGQQKFFFQLIFSAVTRSLSVYNSSCYSSCSFFLPMLHFWHPSLITPCRINPFFGINSIFQVSQRIWFCCWDKLLLLISSSLPSPAAPSSLFLCWQKPICPFASCTFLISENDFFSHTLQGPLTFRFIVNMEAKVDCLLYVMYFHWCPDTLESGDELNHQ